MPDGSKVTDFKYSENSVLSYAGKRKLKMSHYHDKPDTIAIAVAALKPLLVGLKHVQKVWIFERVVHFTADNDSFDRFQCNNVAAETFSAQVTTQCKVQT